MSQRWSSKKDVLKDLEVATGRQVDDVGDGYFLYGEQPPPPRLVDEDDEIELLFGHGAPQGLSQGNVPVPDLIGITKMLRMVQKYENSSDEELPVTPNNKIVIRKPNAFKVPKPHETCLNLKDKGTFKSPNKSVRTDKINLNKAQPGCEIVLSTNERESGENIVSNSKLNASIETGLLETNRGASGDSISPNNELDSSNSSLPATPVKIIVNNGIVTSTLNPYVKEFIPKKAQATSSQSYKSKEENTSGFVVTDTQNNDAGVTINNKKSDHKIDKSEITKDATTLKNGDSSRETKNQVAMMLKNQISIKNDTFEEQQQTNRAIVNLLKLYAEPRSAKPLKLLTPQYFEQSKTKNFKDIESNKTDRSVQQITLLHNANKVNFDETPCTPQGRIVESKEAIAEASGQSENSDKRANDTLFKNRDEEEKNYYKAFTRNDLKENNLKFQEDTNHTFYDKNNDIEKCQENTIYKENNNIEEYNEIESTQLTPDLGEISIGEQNMLSESEIIDPFIKESISKVNRWLSDKSVVTVSEKPKSPVLHLGPVAYKRKDPVTCKSPSEVTEKKVPKAAEYKPSSYAEELHKKYSEQNKINNPAPILNIWEKLDADLKKKDSEIRNRKK